MNTTECFDERTCAPAHAQTRGNGPSWIVIAAVRPWIVPMFETSGESHHAERSAGRGRKRNQRVGEEWTRDTESDPGEER